MTTPVRRFPDVQRILLDELSAVVGDRAAIATPADLEAQLPFVRVRRIGGNSDRLNDYATVDIDVFDGSYAGAEQLAEQLRQYLVGPPPPSPLVDRIDCEAAPQELPWGDTVRRIGATYRVTCRRSVAF